MRTVSSKPNVDARQGVVRARALALGIGLALVCAYATVNLPQSSITSLLAIPVGILILQLGAHAAYARLTGRTFLSAADHVVVFGLCSVAGAIASEWTLSMHTAVHGLPFLADGNPAVKQTLIPNLPNWMIFRELEPVESMRIAGDGPSRAAAMLPHIWPKYLAWIALIGSAAMACFFVNSLMRTAWLEREKLSFPIIQLPIAMTQAGPGSMWRSRLMWAAFGLVFAIDLLNGLNYLYPWLPRIPVKQVLDTGPLLQEPPWNAMGEFPVAVYPSMAALGVFMPNDLLGSAILFFLLRKVVHLVLGLAGHPQGTFSGTSLSPGPPFFEEQAWGGILALFASAMWFARASLKEVWRAIWTGRTESDGGIRHRSAFVGLVVCAATFVGFGLVGKLPVAYLLVYFALFLVFSVVVTRLRAQLGPPTHEFAYIGPSGILSRWTGNQWMSEAQIAWVGQGLLFMNRSHRTDPMPHQLEALKLGQSAGLSMRRLMVAVGIVTLLGLAAGYWFYLVKAYRMGNPLESFDGVGFTQTMLTQRTGPDAAGIAMTVFGFGFVFALDAIRLRVPGFPVHPGGYVLGITYGIDYYWFGLALALATKMVVQRYYGFAGYQRLRHVALGVLLAEYANELIWMIFTLATRQSSYSIGINVRSLGAQ